MDCAKTNNLASIQSLVREELEKLEARLGEIFNSEVPLLDNICTYLNEKPGKRIRPTVLFLAARSAGRPDEKLITAGLAIELVHTATLIHDDVIDDHRIRRGRPTVYSVWGAEAATLAGDYLYSMAFARLSEAGMFDVIEILSRVTHTMSVGELMQLDLRRNLDLSEERYMDMIYRKTASLFSASCESGALLGGEVNGGREAYSRFGKNVGFAFQIVDDLFDYMASDTLTGKPTASDFSEGLVTLPFITAFRNAPEHARGRVASLFGSAFDKALHWNEVVRFVQSYGGVEYSLQRAKHFAERAKAHLTNVASSPERDALFAASDYIVERAFALCR